jgi:hypothetical protein
MRKMYKKMNAILFDHLKKRYWCPWISGVDVISERNRNKEPNKGDEKKFSAGESGVLEVEEPGWAVAVRNCLAAGATGASPRLRDVLSS